LHLVANKTRVSRSITAAAKPERLMRDQIKARVSRRLLVENSSSHNRQVCEENSRMEICSSTEIFIGPAWRRALWICSKETGTAT